MCEFCIERLNVVGDLYYTEILDVSKNRVPYEKRRMEQRHYSITYNYGVTSDRNKISKCERYLVSDLYDRLEVQDRQDWRHSNFSKIRVHQRLTRKIPD